MFEVIRKLLQVIGLVNIPLPKSGPTLQPVRPPKPLKK